MQIEKAGRAARVVVMQALACYGRCSLTVALPVLSCAGVEACPLPTAIFSTHTGFPQPARVDLGEQMEAIAAHWRALGLRFDLIVIGYLGSAEKIDFALRFIDNFAGPETTVLVDPVMGDHGRLYRGFDVAYARRMRELCARADVILPNLTEACLLLEEPYREEGAAQPEPLLARLAALCGGDVVLTGARDAGGRIGAAVYRRETGRAERVLGPCVDGAYHGTGDLFASAVAGGLARGAALERSVRVAVDFTAACMARTRELGLPEPGGVQFEPCLSMLSGLLAEVE